MKQYWFSCESCGWKAKHPVDEPTYYRFMREVGEFCIKCLHEKGKRVKWTVREQIINVRRIFP